VSLALPVPGGTSERSCTLQHFADGAWTSISSTDALPTDGVLVLDGTVSSLSPFGIFLPADPPHVGAGNVKVRISRHKLIVTGDDADNFIRIEAGDAGPESFRVIGAGTTVNGQALAQQFTGVRAGLAIRGGKGNDEIMLDGSAQEMQLKGSVLLDGGPGDDVIGAIGAIGVTALGKFTVQGGSGADSVEMVAMLFNKAAVFTTSAGADH